jgi:hypothetical protein
MKRLLLILFLPLSAFGQSVLPPPKLPPLDKVLPMWHVLIPSDSVLPFLEARFPGHMIDSDRIFPRQITYAVKGKLAPDLFPGKEMIFTTSVEEKVEVLGSVRAFLLDVLVREDTIYRHEADEITRNMKEKMKTFIARYGDTLIESTNTWYSCITWYPQITERDRCDSQGRWHDEWHLDIVAVLTTCYGSKADYPDELYYYRHMLYPD